MKVCQASSGVGGGGRMGRGAAGADSNKPVLRESQPPDESVRTLLGAAALLEQLRCGL